MHDIPFKAALFDLDGTLLDSMYVWKRVDEVSSPRAASPSRRITGAPSPAMSFRETAQYTVDHYLPGEDWRDVCAEWTRLSQLGVCPQRPPQARRECAICACCAAPASSSP